MTIFFLMLAALALIVLLAKFELSWLVVSFLAGFCVILLLHETAYALALPIVLLLLTLLLGRLIVIGYREFADISNKLGRPSTVQILGKTFLRWVPAFLVVVAVVAAMIWRNHYLQNVVYGFEQGSSPTAATCLNAEQQERRLVCPESGSFEDDLHAFATRFGDTNTAALQQGIRSAADGFKGEPQELRGHLLNRIYDSNNPAPLYIKTLPLDIPHCTPVVGYLFTPGKCIKRDLLLPLDKVHKSIRAESRAEFKAKTLTATGEIEQSHDAVLAASLQTVEQGNQAFQKFTHKALDLVFLKEKFTSIAFYAFTLFLLLRIFLYIFIRFAFDARNGGVYLSKPQAALPQEIIMHAMQLQSLGNEVAIDLGEETWYAGKHRKVRYAQKGKPVIPMPMRLAFRRIASRNYYLYRFSEKDRCAQLELYADEVTHFMKVKLSEKDQLCITLKNLVAFSDSVQLNSLFSPKFSVFFKHSLFFTIASGPGELILRVDGGKGKVVNLKYGSTDEPRFFNPVDLIAFDLNGTYELAAQHDLISTYSEGHTTRLQEKGLTIRQIHDEQGARSLLTSLRKLLLFLLPI